MLSTNALSPQKSDPNYSLLKNLSVPFAFTGMFFLFLLFPRIHNNLNLTISFVSAGIVLLGWWAWLAYTAQKNGRMLTIERKFIKVHYVQAVMHMSMYLYWGYYWRPVYSYFPLLFAQIAFSYAFVALLSWSRGDKWLVGMGVFPIIFSTNLFLWFADDLFVFQFLMISIGFLGKEFITWQKDGRKAHIFNPSALSLSLFSLLLLVTGKTDTTQGPEIARTFFNPPFIFPFIFLLGMVVQSLFYVTLTTLGAAVSLLIVNLIYTGVTGTYIFFDAGIHAAVFLGMHLLVTDPATSPKTDLGRFIFGLLYGLLVTVFYVLFDVFGVPGHYDKLLPVPILNLMVRYIDRVVQSPKLERMRAATFGMTSPIAVRNRVYMGVWILLFFGMWGSRFIGQSYPGRNPEFWVKACHEGKFASCHRLVKMYDVACGRGNGKACNDGGVLFAEGKFVKQSDAVSAKAFGRSCLLGYEKGCLNAGVQSILYSVKPVDEKLTLEGVQRSCKKNGNPQGCFLLGKAYQKGRIGHAKLGQIDPSAEIASLFELACSKGFKPACENQPSSEGE